METPNRKLFIDGKWVTGDGASDVAVNPATEESLAHIPAASLQQTNAAIAAARRCFDSGAWSLRSPGDRSAGLARVLSLLDARKEALAELIIAESGCPRMITEPLQIGAAVEHLAWFVEAAVRGPATGWRVALPDHSGPPFASQSVLVREPIGVVAAMTPYNISLLSAIWKVCGALAAGCTTVLLPSPRAQLQSLAFAEIMAEADLPVGAFNIVTGGPEIGRALTESPNVDMVSFTGSETVGAQVMAQSAHTIKKVVLELGGKSPNVMLPGTDYANAMFAALFHFSMNAGQGCICLTRILVPRRDYETALTHAAQILPNIKVGDPRNPDVVTGPLIRAEHRARVENLVAQALDGGGRIIAGGGRPESKLGYFMNPVLLADVAPDAPLAQQELFGPVGVLTPYDSIEEAVGLANASPYGLHANIWGPTEDARALASKIRAGTVTVNGGGALRPDAPFGGHKRSGVGREAGEEGFQEFFETKHIQWAVQ